MEIWRKVYAVCLIVIGFVVLLVNVFFGGVLFGEHYPNGSTDVFAVVFLSGNRSFDFNVTLDYGEYLHYEVVSLTSGAEFNVSLTAYPIYGTTPSENKVVTYKNRYAGFPGSVFGDRFDLVFPHGGSWEVQVLAEGTGELDCKVTRITPESATDLISPILMTTSAICGTSLLVLAAFSLIKQRKKLHLENHYTRS